MSGAATPMAPPLVAHEKARSHRTRKIARAAGLAVSLALIAVSLVLLHRELAATDPAAIRGALAGTPAPRVLLAALLSLAALATMTTYDPLALAWTRASLPRRDAAFASAAATVLGGAVGLGALTGTAARVLLYRRWGVSGDAVAIVVAVTGAMMLAGALAAAGLGLALGPQAVSGRLGLGDGVVRLLGIGLLAATAAFVAWTARRQGGGPFAKLGVAAPGARHAMVQLGAATADWLVAASVLWVLLPQGRPGLVGFVPLYAGAGWLGGLSGAPAGLGAFDAAVLALFPASDTPAVVAGLLVYRVAYYALPLVLLALIGVVLARREARRIGADALRRYEGLAVAVAPGAFAALVFAMGVLVLWSLAVPTLPERAARAAQLLPPVLLSSSHLLGAAAGTALLLVADGLRRRSRGAWGVASVLLVGAAVTDAARGAGGVAALAVLLAAALLASRSAFYRRGGVRLPSLPWIVAAAVGLASFAWIGFIVHRDVPYAQELWSTLAGEGGGAARFLRALAVGGVVTGTVLVARLVDLARVEPAPPRVDADALRAALDAGDRGHADAHLAWLGDKHLVWSASGRTFLQYGVRGRRLVAMGEPYGLEAETEEVLRAFRDHADAVGSAPVLYSFGDELLPEVVALGLAVQKVGETAMIDLPTFALEGSHRQPLRQALRRGEREGLTFEVVPRERTPALLPALRTLSDEWLAIHHGAEKGFTLGRFDAAYLSRFPTAVVRNEGAPVAFANLWTTAGRRELSIDLMRYGAAAPKGVMDFLFTQLALWGRSEGYGVLDLGMAPLAGLDADRLDPLLSRAGVFAYEHGDRFYGFEGLRAYKDKYHPRWEPLYLAAPSRILLPVALADVSLLTSGGVRGLLGHG